MLKKSQQYGIAGTVVVALAMVAHATHAPVLIIGFLGFGTTVLMDSIWVKILMLVMTVVSIGLLWRYGAGCKQDCQK